MLKGKWWWGPSREDGTNAMEIGKDAIDWVHTPDAKLKAAIITLDVNVFEILTSFPWIRT